MTSEGGIARLVRHPLSLQEEGNLRNRDSRLSDGYRNDWHDDLGRLGLGDLVLFHVPSGNGRRPGTITHDGWGRIFASFMAFLSIGAAISGITFTFGPLFGSIFKEGFPYV